MGSNYPALRSVCFFSFFHALRVAENAPRLRAPCCACAPMTEEQEACASRLVPPGLFFLTSLRSCCSCAGPFPVCQRSNPAPMTGRGRGRGRGRSRGRGRGRGSVRGRGRGSVRGRGRGRGSVRERGRGRKGRGRRGCCGIAASVGVGRDATAEAGVCPCSPSLCCTACAVAGRCWKRLCV